MNKKPFYVLIIVVFLIGAFVTADGIQEYSLAEETADYYKPVFRNDCGPSDYSCLGNQIGDALDNARENIAYRNQIESRATKSIIFGFILVGLSIFGFIYLNKKLD
tara:strand:+ start:1502 stop:1819 length:318 start_codon:yes stop_codon:yes gene_type:complete